jgi:hypothetical protein
MMGDLMRHLPEAHLRDHLYGHLARAMADRCGYAPAGVSPAADGTKH